MVATIWAAMDVYTERALQRGSRDRTVLGIYRFTRASRQFALKGGNLCLLLYAVPMAVRVADVRLAWRYSAKLYFLVPVIITASITCDG